ncbi:ATP-dependent DNA helicase RecG [Thioclava litoralis]|uniref:ATP-dependent DNA helicase RecG n=1 Tax=Thioclava litoralis TaxID=3076557 RepID=A0ABZ1DX10_9RHOB|nr:ATP-dependent DNA helicase RecG [Thioclava sp. FTW29]
MAGRPESLFPLFGKLESLPGIGPKLAQTLTQAGLEKPRDLLLTLPYSLVDRRPVPTVAGVPHGQVVTTEVTVLRHVKAARAGAPSRVIVEDAQAEITLVFFRGNDQWFQKQLPLGERRIVSGKVEIYEGRAQIVHPDFILLPEQLEEIPRFEPIYALSAGITQKVMGKAAEGALALLPELPEWIDPNLKKREDWPDWHVAMQAAHHPEDLAHCMPQSPARMRLAYDELFAHQLTLALARRNAKRKPGRVTRGDGRFSARILQNLPYAPTGAQTRAVAEIRGDMASDRRMNRLLQGDVGAGKTLVALLALVTAVEAGGQSVMMAPTEILARQHMEGIAPLARDAGVRVELLTGRDKGADRAAKLEDLAAGRIDILLGTHAVFQKDVHFHDLRFVVIDEQHRFGVAQRMELGAKGQAVDILVMTATPIPRSLALTQYGDMDVSVLDEKPPGRTPVKTALIADERLAEVVAHLTRAVDEGRQAYWVCPLVEESEKSDLQSAEERFKHLRAALGDEVVTLVHGQMSPSEKDAAMAEFLSGTKRVLVATTVIEVGVNVPNASIMVIERAESFGLAQLHQLRGRVGRGAAASTCLLMYRAPLTETGERRLKVLRDSEDGFRIAEEDLALRGAGDMIGTAQSGLPRFRVADLERQAGLMATAQTDARALLEGDPKLESERGRAARTLLWLMEQDRAIKLISVG